MTSPITAVDQEGLMKTWVRASAILAVAVFAWSSVLSGTALAADKDKGQPAAAPGDQKSCAPQKIDGTVTAIDPGTDMITVQGSDGMTHQFRASKDDMKTFKVGDRIGMTLRAASATGC
jgi:Cu/Ag efflux protein CusF